MTRAEFNELPMLLLEHQVVAATGYAQNTLRKLVDCRVLEVVKPKGATKARYRKQQVGRLIGVPEGEWLPGVVRVLRGGPLLMGVKTARVITGYSAYVLAQMAKERSLSVVRPAGLSELKFRTAEIAELCGVRV